MVGGGGGGGGLDKIILFDKSRRVLKNLFLRQVKLFFSNLFFKSFYKWIK